jgi:transcriptional regulator with XRE-family HTH domain
MPQRYPVGMADFKTATTVGARIAALRTARGFSSAKALAEAIPGGSVTESILQNIEAGRQNDLTVAQLLNIAWALRVSPVFILAPLGSPHEHVDLPGVIPEVQSLTVAEFDAWISVIDGAYRPISVDEHSERVQLAALRELLRARREAHRLTVVNQREQEATSHGEARDSTTGWANTQQRLDDANRQIAQLETYLETGGWSVFASSDHGEVSSPVDPESR